MKTTKKDFITGAVVITIVLASMVNAAPQPISEMETTPRNCCCCAVVKIKMKSFIHLMMLNKSHLLIQ